MLNVSELLVGYDAILDHFAESFGQAGTYQRFHSNGSPFCSTGGGEGIVHSAARLKLCLGKMVLLANPQVVELNAKPKTPKPLNPKHRNKPWGY